MNDSMGSDCPLHATSFFKKVTVPQAKQRIQEVLKTLAKNPPIREDKVMKARVAIADGTFETVERIDGAVAALYQEFAFQ